MIKIHGNTEYDYLCDIIERGDITALDEACIIIESFPHGIDGFINRYWIINAIDFGAYSSIEWMIQQGVRLDIIDDEGYTPLLSAIDRNHTDKYAVLEVLLKAGAPVNQIGANGQAPAHMAACRNDVTALMTLVKHGADTMLKTDEIEPRTVLEEAKFFHSHNVISKLEKKS